MSDDLTAMRKRLARFERQRLKMEGIITDVAADEDERRFLTARLLKSLAVWRSMLEAQA